MENNYNIITLSLVVLGVVLTLVPVTGKLLNHIVTLIHELGHAIAAILLRGEIRAIRIEPDGSGSTVSGHALTFGYKVNRILVLLSGYSFPLYLGVVLVSFAFLNPIVNFWILGVLSLISLIFVRNLFGLLIVLIFIGGAATVFIPGIPLAFVPAFLGSIVVVGGWRDLILISKSVWQRRVDSSDFNLLAEETGVGSRFWLIFFYIYNSVITTGIVTLVGYLFAQ